MKVDRYDDYANATGNYGDSGGLSKELLEGIVTLHQMTMMKKLGKIEGVS